MSDEQDTNTSGVLSGLPSTRPQRRSVKRAPGESTSAARPPAAAKPANKKAAATRTPATARTPAKKAAAARTPAGAGADGQATPTRTGGEAEPGAARRAPRPAPTAGRRAQAPPAAAQGYEPDGAQGAVDPPSRTALAGSVAQGAGELVQAGFDLGRHLLRAVLGRLPGG